MKIINRFLHLPLIKGPARLDSFSLSASRSSPGVRSRFSDKLPHLIHDVSEAFESLKPNIQYPGYRGRTVSAILNISIDFPTVAHEIVTEFTNF